MTPEETLDWLADQHFDQCREERPIQDWIRKMKVRLPKQEKGEPVAWMDEADLIFRVDWKNKIHYNGSYVDLGRAIPDRWKPVLYTTPQQRKPLTDEQERFAFEQHWYDFYHCGSISARPSGTYVHPAVQKAWEAWQARAALGVKGEA